jgi:hypothetical protein
MQFKKGNKVNLGRKWSIEDRKKLSEAHLKSYKSNTIASIHARIRTKYGKPRHCVHCEKDDKKQYDWANIDHKYNEKEEDWIRLCRGCHIKYDTKFNNKQNGRKAQNSICK